MKYLLDNPHDFTFEQVNQDYEDRLDEPDKIEVSGTETAASIKARFIAYDEYKQFDRSLSRLAVESLMSPDFREQIF